MRPNTSEPGIFSTKSSRPVTTSMLVPKQKKAFQSPGVHKIGLNPDFPAGMPVLILPLRLPSRLRCPLSSPQELRPSR
jgi:hypothetical protein